MQKSKHAATTLLDPADAAIAKMIAVRAGRGESLERIARTSKIPYSRIRRIAVLSQIRYKHRRPTKEQIRAAVRAVRDEGASIRAGAKLAGISRTAAHRYVSRKRQASIDSAGDLVVEDGTRKYSRKKRTWTCAVHGRLINWPCVACAALAAKAHAKRA